MFGGPGEIKKLLSLTCGHMKSMKTQVEMQRTIVFGDTLAHLGGTLKNTEWSPHGSATLAGLRTFEDSWW